MIYTKTELCLDRVSGVHNILKEISIQNGTNEHEKYDEEEGEKEKDDDYDSKIVKKKKKKNMKKY